MEKILVVDDDPILLTVITEQLASENYHVTVARNGKEAFDIINKEGSTFHTILLDRMMPDIDGIDILKKIKEDPRLKAIPVIMQTALANRKDVVDGIAHGAFYYLTKPSSQEVLCTTVRSAMSNYQSFLRLIDRVKHSEGTFKCLQSACFDYQTLTEARELASSIALACPESEKVVVGLAELLINAIEHGNLGISYDEKSQLLTDETWAEEINRRLAHQAYKDKFATIEFSKSPYNIDIIIRDQGNGFDWQPYMELSPDRAFDSHGRGILMARQISFDSIEYNDKGTEVRVSIDLA